MWFTLLLSHWRLVATVAAGALIGGLLFTVRIQHAEVVQAKAAASAAQAEVKVQTQAAKVVDQVATKTIIIHDQTQAAENAVLHASGADAQLPPDVVAAWAYGIDSLRDDPPGSSTGLADKAVPAASPPAEPHGR